MKSRSKYKGERFTGQSVRIRQSNGKCALERIGMADDFADANGATALNFMQAQRKSQERYSSVKKLGGIVRDVEREFSDASTALRGTRSASGGVRR